MTRIAAARWAALGPTILVAALFASQAFALWQHRVDYPVIDDWRYYIPETALPRHLRAEWLLAPARDTLHVTGKLIDWLVLRLVSHDYRVLAATSFVLAVGTWLAAAVGLLFLLSQGRPWLRAAGLLALCPALAGVPYWVTVSPLQRVEPAIAYHQMLPLVGVFAFMLLALADTRRWPRGSRPALALALGVAFGLSYNVGGLALFTFGATVLVLGSIHGARLEPPGSLRSIATISLVTGALCLALHVLVPLLEFGRNPIYESRALSVSYALPHQPEFWLYAFGLFDRAFGSTAVGALGDLRGAAGAAIFAAAPIALGVLLARGRVPADDRPRATVLTGGLVTILVYCAVVSYARAALGDLYVGDTGDRAVRLYARSRFFFWWITASLPLALFAWALLLEATAAKRTAAVVASALLAFALWPRESLDGRFPTRLDQWDHTALYARDAEILTKLARSDAAAARGRKKERYHPGWVRHLARKPRKLYERASKLDATFVDRWELVPERAPRRKARSH